MKIKSLNYQKLYPVGAYLNHRIGFEASLDEGDDPLEVLAQLKELADTFHKESNPPSDTVNTDPEKLPEQQVDSKETRIGVMVKDINSCSDIKILETYRFIVKQSPELQKAYDLKMEQLLKTPKDGVITNI